MVVLSFFHPTLKFIEPRCIKPKDESPWAFKRKVATGELKIIRGISYLRCSELRVTYAPKKLIELQIVSRVIFI